MYVKKNKKGILGEIVDGFEELVGKVLTCCCQCGMQEFPNLTTLRIVVCDILEKVLARIYDVFSLQWELLMC